VVYCLYHLSKLLHAHENNGWFRLLQILHQEMKKTCLERYIDIDKVNP
jgi:hypothetical protein